MQHSKFVWIVGACTAVGVLCEEARAAFSSASEARVGFEAKGPAGFKIAGTTTELSVDDTGTSFVVSVPLGNLNTGIDLRDHHMKEKYLEVPKFPSAVLTVARSAVKIPSAGERVEGDAPATLALHGVSRPVSVHYDARAEGATIAAHGKFHLNMNDFGINVPSYLGVTVKPDIDVSASFRVAGS